MKPTWHLNLKYTVGDMDRVKVIRQCRYLTVGEIAAKFDNTPLATTPERIRQLATDFGLPVRGPIYETGRA